MTAIDPGELVRRYVAVWHEPDAELRRKAVHDLWAEDGAHVLQPPEEMRQAAAGLGFPSLVLRARGHEELEPGDPHLPVAGAGLEILVLDTDGRITTDYQFIEG